MQSISDRLKRLRLEKNLKQSDLGEIFKCGGVSISNYENGRNLSNDLLIAYAKYFDVSTDWILGLTNDRKPGGSDLNAAMDALAAQVNTNNGAPFTPDQLMQLLMALRAYYRAGAPAGNAPVEVLSAFIAAMTDAANVARTGTTAELLAATNAVAVAGLDASKILAQYLAQKEE